MPKDSDFAFGQPVTEPIISKAAMNAQSPSDWDRAMRDVAFRSRNRETWDAAMGAAGAPAAYIGQKPTD